MASVIKAGNATDGVQVTSDNTGILELKTGTGAGTTAMTVDASQNVGIGTSSPSYRLQVESGSTATGGQAWSHSAGTVYARLGVVNPGVSNDTEFGTFSNNSLRLITNNTERARITSDGFFKAQANSTYVGSTSAYHEFITASGNQNTAKFRSNATNGQQYGIEITTANDQNDAVRSFIQCAGAATVRAEMRSNGGLANYSANNVNLASDQRLKKDISLLDTSWDKVKQIEVVNFRYKDCNEGDPLLYGVIAQQVQPIVPELVVVTQEAKEATEDTEATPEYYGIREQPMYWLAIKALQEAMARIETLEAEVAVLKGAAQ